MPFTWQALSAVWVIIFGLFALVSSGMVTGNGVWLLVLGVLAAPAIILSAFGKLRKGVLASANASHLAIGDARDLNSDKG